MTITCCYLAFSLLFSTHKYILTGDFSWLGLNRTSWNLWKLRNTLLLSLVFVRHSCEKKSKLPPKVPNKILPLLNLVFSEKFLVRDLAPDFFFFCNKKGSWTPWHTKVPGSGLDTGGIFTSLAKEVMFLAALVCLSVCGQHYSRSYEWIGTKLYGGVLGSTMKNWLNFGGDLGILRWVND